MFTIFQNPEEDPSVEESPPSGATRRRLLRGLRGVASYGGYAASPPTGATRRRLLRGLGGVASFGGCTSSLLRAMERHVYTTLGYTSGPTPPPVWASSSLLNLRLLPGLLSLLRWCRSFSRGIEPVARTPLRPHLNSCRRTRDKPELRARSYPLDLQRFCRSS
ncbi:hypothetical protein CesoFtcFv8_004416 [Champsocephalus esox]|uniref:Uncharacterized protein n=1 Tax=Champsocephalus esox TaxID=159716 RepID=A0AAN8CYW4_9TELE|nr:hypothetical protein CesoFtcFv8_004416 [Champsocephalus esox]